MIFVTFFGGMLTLKMKVVNRDLSRYVHFTKYSIACTWRFKDSLQMFQKLGCLRVFKKSVTFTLCCVFCIKGTGTFIFSKKEN